MVEEVQMEKCLAGDILVEVMVGGIFWAGQADVDCHGFTEGCCHILYVLKGEVAETACSCQATCDVAHRPANRRHDCWDVDGCVFGKRRTVCHEVVCTSEW